MTQGVIIGGGIAGLSAAIFARQQGMDVAVYERGRSDSCDDHLLWIAPNGLHILDRLGLLDDILEQTVDQEIMRFSDRMLSPLMTLHGQALRKTCGFPIVAIRRRQLWQAIAQKWTGLGGTIQNGFELQNIVTSDNEVTLHFANHEDPVRSSWVIGADGMGSQVRKLFAPQSIIQYQGIRTWLGKSHTTVAKNYVGSTIEAWGAGSRFVLTSLDGEWIHFSALERSQTYEANNAPIASETLPRLRNIFAEYHDDVQAVLANADPTSLVRCNFGVVSNLRQTHAGLMTVIGDAAHGMPPNMGQGASLGLEDALWVTYELSRSPDPRLAFERYANARQSRVGEMRSLANAMNRLFQPESRWAQRLRDKVAAVIPDSLTARRMGALYQPAVPPIQRLDGGSSYAS